jgi:hypothetical protein
MKHIIIVIVVVAALLVAAAPAGATSLCGALSHWRGAPPAGLVLYCQAPVDGGPKTVEDTRLLFPYTGDAGAQKWIVEVNNPDAMAQIRWQIPDQRWP